MGKTGITEWIQIKGSKGQVRLVPKKESTHKKPGPNQRFKSNKLIKIMERSSGDARGRGGRGGSRGGGPAGASGSSGGSRGGRGGRSRGGQQQSFRAIAARRRIVRPRTSIKGARQKI
jgi:hypothetical protein